MLIAGTPYERLERRWNQGDVVILDGGIGSELERVGYPSERNIDLLWGTRALYEAPDGWSRIVSHLATGTFVTVTGTEGNFLRVKTADGRGGYVSQNARANLVMEGHHA